MDLAELFRHHGTDKDRNGYTPLYHMLTAMLFADGAPAVLLEIGIGTMTPGAPSSMRGYMPDTYRPGASLRAWADHLPHVSVVGVDPQTDCLEAADPGPTTHARKRIRVVQSNASEAAAAERIRSACIDPIRLVIDDGSHLAEDQEATLRNLWPLVATGGVYVIEDITPGSLLAKEPDRLTAATHGSPAFFVGQKLNQAVIYKHPLRTFRERWAW